MPSIRRRRCCRIYFWIDALYKCGEWCMRYLHTMVRVRDLDASLHFYCEGLGLHEVRRKESEQGKFTLVFLAAAESPEAEIELTYNWPAADGSTEDYGS